MINFDYGTVQTATTSMPINSGAEGTQLLTVKGKVKCTLVQTLRLCTGRTGHRGVRGIALLFFTTALEWGEGSASRPGRFLPPE